MPDYDEADRIAARIASEWTDMRKGATLAEVLVVVDAYQQTRARLATLEAERDRLQVRVADALGYCAALREEGDSGDFAAHVQSILAASQKGATYGE